MAYADSILEQLDPASKTTPGLLDINTDDLIKCINDLTRKYKEKNNDIGKHLVVNNENIIINEKINCNDNKKVENVIENIVNRISNIDHKRRKSIKKFLRDVINKYCNIVEFDKITDCIDLALVALALYCEYYESGSESGDVYERASWFLLALDRATGGRISGCASKKAVIALGKFVLERVSGRVTVDLRSNIEKLLFDKCLA